MTAPTKVWRRWHRQVNTHQRRFAVASALAASAVPALVAARGHRIENLAEVPLVVADASIASLTKTKDAEKLLRSLGLGDDLDRVAASRSLRAGGGKQRNRRFVSRRGPLVVYGERSLLQSAAHKALRNVEGVDAASVHALNLLQLAPGGHVGRLIVWTESAFRQLGDIFGSTTADSKVKTGFRVPRAIMTLPDVSRVLASAEIQAALRPRAEKPQKAPRKKNALKNTLVAARLNPHAAALRRRRLLAEEAAKARRSTQGGRVAKKNGRRSTEFVKMLLKE